MFLPYGLEGDGFEMVRFGQGYQGMNWPTKKLEELVIGAKLAHGVNPKRRRVHFTVNRYKLALRILERQSVADMAFPSPVSSDSNMASDPSGSITHFFIQLRGGDGEAAQRLWEHFAPRMLGLARKTLANRPRRVADAEDAVQDGFLEFWRQATEGKLDDDLNRDNLWKLLGTITVRKALKQAERQRAQKRGGGRVHGESSVAGLDGEAFRLDEVLGQLPGQELDSTCEELLLQLDEGMRAIAVLKLMQHTNAEIANSLGVSISTVERKLNLIRRIWDQESSG